MALFLRNLRPWRTTSLLTLFLVALVVGFTLRQKSRVEEFFDGGSPDPVRWTVSEGRATDCPPSSSVHASQPSPSGLATYLPASKLLCRALASDLVTVPKLLHQSWKSNKLPAKFEGWSRTCREKHPDWEWVLWTDDDNLELVRRYFPWLEDTFASLPGDIYRADLARNLYMYLFGGVYIDLDTECLRPTSAALDALHVSHAATDASNTTVRGGAEHQRQVAMFGRMGNDANFQHSIPNAWMAAPPGHPFFLMPLVAAKAAIAEGRSLLHKLWHYWPSAEQMTGPIALRKAIRQYQTRGLGLEVRRLAAVGPFAAARPQDLRNDLVLLDDFWVYPFNWRKADLRAICSVEKEGFDAERCKAMLETSEKGSISITYWSHTHRGKGVDEHNIGTLNQED